jgi:small subunit ribosomal protein S16
MRLQRFGKKGKPFYHIVIADGRASRDGRFIEKIGTYNPIPNPAEIVLNAEKALNWLQNGAQPTDTVRAILSYKGIIYKNHLLKGVKKGAFSEAEAEAKYQTWLKEKDSKVDAKRKSLEEKARTSKKDKLAAEAKVNEERAADIAKQRKDVEDAKVKAAQAAASETEAKETPAPSVEEEMVTKEAVEEKVKENEAKAIKEEVKAEEPVVEEKPEVVEAPKAEAKSEETPVAEEKKEEAEAKTEDKKETKE